MIEPCSLRSTVGHSDRGAKLCIAAMFSILLLYPPLYSLYTLGIKTVFAYFPADTFYYLTVAKNSQIGFFSFDGQQHTNGFHPLWQYMLTGLSGLIGRDNSEAQLYLTFLLSALLTTVGFILAGWSIYRRSGSTLLTIWLIPGLFYLLFTIRGGGPMEAPGITYSYSPWAFMNGLESSLSILFGGMFIFLVSHLEPGANQVPRDSTGQPSWNNPFDYTLALIGLTIALMVLARLDDVFLLLSVLLFGVWSSDLREARLRRLIVLAFPTVTLLLAYMTYNYVSGQSLLPVSGSLKSTGGAAFSGNLNTFLSDLFPAIHELIRPNYSLEGWSVTAARSSAMLLPMGFALWFLIYIRILRNSAPEEYERDKWLVPMLLYIVFKGSYNLINVRLGSQGYWYYAVAILMLNYMVIVLTWDRLGNVFRAARPVIKGGVVAVYIVMYLFQSANIIYLTNFLDGWHYAIWKDRREITAAIKKADPRAKIIDRSDGIVAYALDVPAISALGYTLDYGGYLAKKEGRFLEYALRRGFNATFSGAHAYPMKEGLYRYTEIYRHVPTDTIFLRIEPRTEIKVSHVDDG